MRFGTYIAFGIKPSVLKGMMYEEALKAQKQGAINRKISLTLKSPNMAKWSKRRKELVDYAEKSIAYFDAKLDELKI